MPRTSTSRVALSPAPARRAAVLLAFIVIPCAYVLVARAASPGWFYVLLIAAVYMLQTAGLAVFMSATGKAVICQAAFFGTGAYLYAILATHMTPSGAACIAVVATGCSAAILGRIMVRLSGDFFAIATLTLNVVFSNAISNLTQTGGPAGLTRIRPLHLGPWPMTTNLRTLGVLVVLVTLVVLAGRHALSRPFGHLLKAGSYNPVLVRSWGVRLAGQDSILFGFAASVAALAGVFYASITSVITPDTFTFLTSFQILIFVIVGGSRSLTGPVFACVILMSLSESVRSHGDYAFVVYGTALLVVVMVNREGLAGITTKALAALSRLFQSREPSHGPVARQ